MERMAAEPTASVPQACHGWGETIAAYRFFDNEKVQWHAILEPHWLQTQKRMQTHQVVLCLQDTTELDFNGQETIGLGPLTYEAQRGMFVHPTYAVTPQREPLGILDAWMWAREKKDESGQRGGPKESLRWIEGYERIAEMAPDMPSTRLVYVADREADLMALMECADALGNPADWLVRAAHNRCLPEGDKLWERATRGEAVGQIAFTMAARQGVKARTVRQRLWLQRVELPASKGKSIAATCLVAREFDAPAGVKPIEWRLLTNRAATTLDEAIELIEWYRARWEIEILFNVLKNGCQVEELQLGTIERLERALALFLVVAWRVTYLMRLGRTCPDLDAHLFFDPDEIRPPTCSRKRVCLCNPSSTKCCAWSLASAVSSLARAMANPARRQSGRGSQKFISPRKPCAYCAMTVMPTFLYNDAKEDVKDAAEDAADRADDAPAPAP